jgi:hypothetical protein
MKSGPEQPDPHATQLSDETMRLMREKGIFAVPTFTIFDYFAHHRDSQDQAATESEMLDYKISEFKKQIAAGIQFAVGSESVHSRTVRRPTSSR